MYFIPVGIFIGIYNKLLENNQKQIYDPFCNKNHNIMWLLSYIMVFGFQQYSL